MAEEKGQEKEQENQPGKCPGKTPGKKPPEKEGAVSRASVSDIFDLAVELIRGCQGPGAQVTLIVRTPRPRLPSAARILSTDDNLQGLMESVRFTLEEGASSEGLTAH